MSGQCSCKLQDADIRRLEILRTWKSRRLVTFWEPRPFKSWKAGNLLWYSKAWNISKPSAKGTFSREWQNMEEHLPPGQVTSRLEGRRMPESRLLNKIQEREKRHLCCFLCMILPKKSHGAFVGIEHIWKQSSSPKAWLHGSPLLKCFGKSLACSCMYHFVKMILDDFGTSPPENTVRTERMMSGQRRSKRLNSSGNMTAWLKNETKPVEACRSHEK